MPEYYNSHFQSINTQLTLTFLNYHPLTFYTRTIPLNLLPKQFSGNIDA